MELLSVAIGLFSLVLIVVVSMRGPRDPGDRAHH